MEKTPEAVLSFHQLQLAVAEYAATHNLVPEGGRGRIKFVVNENQDQVTAEIYMEETLDGRRKD